MSRGGLLEISEPIGRSKGCGCRAEGYGGYLNFYGDVVVVDGMEVTCGMLSLYRGCGGCEWRSRGLKRIGTSMGVVGGWVGVTYLNLYGGVGVLVGGLGVIEYI